MSPSVELLCVAPQYADKLLGQVGPWIKEAIRRGGISDYEPLERAIRSGMALMWLAVRDQKILAVAVTELQGSAGRKVCLVSAVAGRSRDEWLCLSAGIEKYAKAEGCQALQAVGRQGWKRVLPDWKLKSIVIEKDLT